MNLRAARPHIHEFACELLQLADRKRFPRDCRFDQETEIRKKEPPPLDATGSAGPAQPAPGCAAGCAAATVLLGIPGLLVTAVTQTQDGQTLVEVITDPALEAPRCCPRCGRPATPVKEHPRTAPRDVFIGDRQVLLDWRKTRWHCGAPGCGQGTFTEWLPAVKPRARLTSRLRTRLGEAVGDDLMPAAAAARRYGVSDRTATRAFTSYADEQLAAWTNSKARSRPPGSMSSAAGPPPTARTRRPARSPRPAPNGSPTWWTWTAAAPWAWPRPYCRRGGRPAHRHAATLRYLAMDMSATYRSGAPAGVTLVADAFHLVKLANRKIDDAFRRLGYRTEHAHEELGLPRPLHYMLRYNIENLTPVTWPPSSACWTPTPTASRSPRSGSPRSTCATRPYVSNRNTSPPRPARSATSSPASTSGAP